ncbi:MAG TPA: TIGR04551 family protein, partial [Myxococcales bacterium]
NNFVFNRAFNVDMILWRNLVTTVTSGWYVKPSLRYRPTGRKTGGGDDTGFELLAGIIYSQAWYTENTPGLEKPLGVELNVGITYDTSDRFHTGFAYGALLPFGGLKNVATGQSAGIAHAARFIMAIPF